MLSNNSKTNTAAAIALSLAALTTGKLPAENPGQAAGAANNAVAQTGFDQQLSSMAFGPFGMLGNRGDGPVRRLFNPPAVSENVHFERTVYLDAKFESVLNYLIYLNGTGEKNQAARAEFARTLLTDHKTSVVSIAPPKDSATHGRLLADGKTKLMTTEGPQITINQRIQMPRKTVGFTVPLVQQSVVTMGAGFNIQSVQLQTTMPCQNVVPGPLGNDFLGAGPYSTKMTFSRSDDPKHANQTKITLSGDCQITSFRRIGRGKVLAEGPETFAQSCAGVLSRAKAHIEKDVKNPERRVKPMELIQLMRNMKMEAPEKRQ